MSSTATASTDATWLRRLGVAVARVLVGALLLSAALSVVMGPVEVLPRSARVLWPSLLAAALMAKAYQFYARRIEHRAGDEFALRPAAFEFGTGVAGGAALVGAVFALLAALHVFSYQGRHPVGLAALNAVSEMVLVSFFEEILVRGIVLKALERPLGSPGAVLMSSLLFGAAHLFNNGATVLSTVNATVAGVLFGAAFVATRRLWLPIGLHLGWNLTAGYVFSAAVSGHDIQSGLFFGALSGPGWLTGGLFGMEGSVVTSMVLLAGTSLLLAVSRRHQRGALTDISRYTRS